MRFYFTVLLVLCGSPAWAEVVHHDLQLNFSPDSHELQATDQVLLFEKPKDGFYRFRLAPGLTVKNAQARRIEASLWQLPVVEEPGGRLSVMVEYEGIIHNPILEENSDGLIDPAGISLFGASQWYPQRNQDLVTFSLKASLPGGWSLITQSCSSLQPQEEIYLIAGPFFNYYRRVGSGLASRVYLRTDEEELAKKYLDKIPDFISHYANLIAPYPYRSFSVVENFWETGLGMPSFTLLGSNVLRLPFLFTSSLPHEILHNWWGNGVYVDYSRGNWSEGLTTYMADHWQKNVVGEGHEYRRSTMALFQDYVRDNNDFPVRQFRGRHNAGSQAIGYGKSMFFFHMLSQRLGEETFIKGLRLFYETNAYQRAGFEEIQTAMERVSGQSLGGFFHQWLDRMGSPQLQLVSAVPEERAGFFGLRLKLRQESSFGLYDLRVPVVLTLKDGSEDRHLIDFATHEKSIYLPARSAVKKLAVDPAFDVFRTLYPEERPPSVSFVLGAGQAHFLRASQSHDAATFTNIWKTGFTMTSDRILSESEALPEDGALIFVGASSIAQKMFNDALKDQDVRVTDQTVFIDEASFARADHTIALVARLGQRPALWVFWPEGTDAQRFAERLRHYSSYGAVVFKGHPNVLKQTWRVTHSPLTKSY